MTRVGQTPATPLTPNGDPRKGVYFYSFSPHNYSMYKHTQKMNNYSAGRERAWRPVFQLLPAPPDFYSTLTR